MSTDAQQKHPLYVKDCECGCPIGFVKDYKGDIQVLDLRSPIFSIVKLKRNGTAYLEAVRTGLHFVSHFVTCPKRDQFRKAT